MLKVKHAQQTITVDGWIEFDAAPRVGVLFRQARANRLSRRLRVRAPKSADPPAEQPAAMRDALLTVALFLA